MPSLTVERELEHQRIAAAGLRALGAPGFGKRGRERLGLDELCRREPGFCDQRANRGCLVGAVDFDDALA